MVPPLAQPICKSPGFAKKELAAFKLDLPGLCEFGCRYCSSNMGNYLRIRRERFADLAEEQLGERIYPGEDPTLMMFSPETLPRLEEQLRHHRPNWGADQTLVFSMLTDGFSPWLVQRGHTRRALDLLLDHTRFRIRVLTKSAIVGKPEWIDYFAQHRDRFVVGLSTGTTDDEWSRKIELGTSQPTARLRALHRLQQAGVPTFGMLCPVFPDMLDGDRLDRLVDAIHPELVEHVWAEPYNDRVNWRAVRAGYDVDSAGYRWLTDVYEHGSRRAWSEYTAELYGRLHKKAEAEGWLHKLRYLLYEDGFDARDVDALGDLAGILFQSKPDDNGFSKNAAIAERQKRGRRARASGDERRE